MTNPVNTINNTIDSNLHVSDFYNISVQSKRYPHTSETKIVKILDIHSNNDDGTGHRDTNVSGTVPAYTFKSHFSTCTNNRVIGSFKAKKYIFPRQDKKHHGYYEGTHTDREKLEYFMNTSVGWLNEDQYRYYCKLSGRDVKLKEISKLGIPSTVYEIRNERKKYGLANPTDKKKENKEVLMCSKGTAQEEKKKLIKLKLEYLENKSSVFDKIKKSLEDQTYVSKNKAKKFERFEELAMGRSNNLSNSKLVYFLKQTVCLLNGPEQVTVLKVNIKQKPGSPHIYGIPNLNNTETAPLVDMLVDTGSDICLISEKMLGYMGIDPDRILPSVSYNIQSSSDLVKNATVGRITVTMHLVTRSGALVKTRIPFIVAHEKMELGKIILGDTFLTRQSISIQYGAPNRPRIAGKFHTDMGPQNIQLRVKGESINCRVKINNNRAEFSPDAVILDSCYTLQLPKKGKPLDIPGKIELPPQIGLGMTKEGRPYLTNANNFIINCKAENDERKHEVRLCPDYRSCSCPYTSKYTDTQRHDFMDNCLYEEMPGYNNTHPFLDVQSYNSQTKPELKSCFKEKGGINIASDGNLQDSINSGGDTPGQTNCFSPGINTEEELRVKDLNIMSTLTEAGECLPLIQVNNIQYEPLVEKQRGGVATDIPVFTPPPLRSGANKVKSIGISKIKHGNICNYCKMENCTCLNKCHSNCNSHFSHCVCYNSCQVCKQEPSDCACILTCQYCHLEMMRSAFIAQGARCDCITVASTSMAERLADSHVSIDQQDDIGLLVQERMDRYDLHPTPHGSRIDTSHIDTTTARKIRLLEKEYASSFATHSLDCGEFEGFQVDLVMDPAGSHQEKERHMDQHVKDEIKDTMAALEAQGIVGPALEHGRFQSNIHAVAKPSPGKILSGKAEANIERQAGIKGNKSRLCIDFRGPNKWLEDTQKLSLPSYRDLQQKFKDKIISTIDLCSMFFAIKLRPSSQKYTNFWYNKRLLSFKRLIMGLKSSTFIAMSAARNTYSQKNFLKFLKMKGILPGSEQCPILDIEECILLYIDDIAVFTPQNIKNATQLHLLILEFVFFATGMLGFKMKKSKINVMCTVFKFLGHQFNTGDVSTQIPEDKAEAFSKLRAPLSCAEAISRLGALAYFSSYIPLLRTIAAPIQTMAHSGEFFWGREQSLAWETLKLLCALKFKNMNPLKDRPLFLAVDSSQISTGYLIFQLSDDGTERMIYTGSKLFNAADRNRPAGAREMLGMLFSLIENEQMIRNHTDQVIVLTDCISLQSLQRLKSTVPRMLEASLFLSTFSNLGIYYTPGVHLYFADLVSRSYNNTFLSRPDNISSEWSKILPPLDRKRHAGARISPSQLTDFILHNPTREVIDCFAKGDLYKQDVFRYHTMTVKDVLEETVSKELSFLASLYSGWNATQMTTEQFAEALEKLKQFPAGALTKKLSNPNLSVLRNKLHNLNMDKLLIAVLRRKYIPDKTSTDRTIQEEMDLLNIPNIMQQRIEQCLKSQNRTKKDMMTSTNKKRVYATEHIPDLEYDSEDEDSGIRVYPHKGPQDGDDYPRFGATGDRNCPDEQYSGRRHDLSDNKSQLGATSHGNRSQHDHSSPDGQHSGRRYDFSDNKSKLGATSHGNSSQVEQVPTRSIARDDISYSKLQSLSHQEICQLLNINKRELMAQLKSIEPHVKQILSQLPLGVIGLQQDRSWSEEKLMKMLIILMDIVNSVTNESRCILKVGFYEDCTNFKLRFLEDKIAVCTSREVTVQPFSIISIPLMVGMTCTSEIYFEQETSLTQIIAETGSYKAGPQTFRHMDVQNLSNSTLTIPSGTVIGHFTPLSFKKCNITPIRMTKEAFLQLAEHRGRKLVREAREDISEKIANMLQYCQQDMTESTAQEAQVMATKLCYMAKIPTSCLPSHPSGQKSLDKGKLLSNLNSILVGQYLFKNKLNIDIEVLAEIQAKDSDFTRIITNLQKHRQKDNSFFLDHENILFKKTLVYNQVMYRLCLPTYLGKQVLTNLHGRKFHPSRSTLLKMYNAVFFTPNVEKITKEITNSCILCMLNQRHQKKKVTGSKRTDTTMTPGHCWHMDIAYMKKAKSGFKFILVMTEVMTNYTSLLPLRSIHVSSLIAAVQLFLNIMPKPSVVITDYGSEYSLKFTDFLSSLDIQHRGGMPRRSQQQGTVEKSISIIRAVLNRIQASEMKEWPVLLPRVMNAINGMHPGGSQFSRTHLLFSPFMTDSPLLGTKYPVITQAEALQGEYEKRARNLYKQSQEKMSNRHSSFVNGQYVVLRTEDKNTPSPRQGDIFKVSKVEKNGMAITIINLRTGGRKVVPFNFITSIDLDRLTKVDYGIPDLFERVKKLNYKNRNWSEPGVRKRKINIMDETTLAGDTPKTDEDTESPLDDEVMSEEDDMFLPEEDETGQHDQHNPNQETSDQANWSHEPEVIPDEEEDIDDPHKEDTDEEKSEHTIEQDTDNKRYRLRPRTVKKQYVFSVKTLKPTDYHYDDRKDTVNSFRMKPVHRQTHKQYAVHALKAFQAKPFDQETEYLECSDMATFYAMKRAMRIHFRICNIQPCKECNVWTRVHNVKWTPNQRGYAECLIDVEKINVEKRKPTKIKFSEEPVKVKLVKRYLPIDVYTLSLATKFCTSLKEVRGMSQHLL